jgi:ketosteroid isomerase-like protein
VSAQNVDVVRRAYEHFVAHGDLLAEVIAPDFVWDMSHFDGWLEQQLYPGIDGARKFLADWTEAWDDWTLDLVELVDAGDEVVALLRQQGRSKTTGLTVDMEFAQLWSVRDGKQTRMRMFADPADGLKAAGIAAPDR